MDWNNLYKIRLNNCSDAFVKHEIVKLLIVKNLLQKNNKKKRYHEIYTEYRLHGKFCDVYHKNNLTNEIICYEIQKDINDKWLKETKEAYNKVGLYWELIDLNKLSNNLDELNKQVKELIL